jgi:hypothetical protein
MNSQEIESRFASLKQARDRGSISDAQFRESVAQMRIQASNGQWYQIDPNDGRWMTWNGTTWEKVAMPAAQAAAQPQSRQPGAEKGMFAAAQANARAAIASQEKIPTKFFPLLAYIAKATGKVFMKQFPMMVFFGILGWLLHTYLLVVVNEGFNPDSWVGQLLATQGNSLAGTIIWMVGSGLLFSWLGQKLFGPKNQPKPPKQPSFEEMFREAGELAMAAIAAAAGICLVISIFAQGWGSAAVALGITGTMLTASGSVVGLIVSSAWSSTYGLSQSAKTKRFSITTGKVAMIGSIGAFLLGALIPGTLLKFILGGALLGLAFYLTHRQGTSTGAMFTTTISTTFFMMGLAYLWYHGMSAYADDGGWREAGGTFPSWIASAGAIPAMLSGLFPGIGAAIGPSLYQVLINMGYNINMDGATDESDAPVTPPIPPVTTKLKDENGNDLPTWDPNQYGAGANGQDGKPGWVWYNGNWVDPAAAKNQIDKINPEMNMPPAPKINMNDEDGKPITTWEPGKYGPDTKGNTGKPGMVWHWGEWVTPEQAQKEIAQDQQRQAEDAAQSQKMLDEWRAKNAADLVKEREQAAIAVAAANAIRAQQAQQAAMDKYWADRIVNKMGKDPNLGQEIKDAAARGDVSTLKALYGDKLKDDMSQNMAEAQHQENMAKVYQAGEYVAKGVVAASKGALIAVGGPAGMVVTGVAVGSISAAQEGTQSYVNGDSMGQVFGHTAVGFATGFKDGAVGVYTQMPGVSTAAKYLVPAGADVAQTFIQGEINDPKNVMGNLGKAFGAGGMSIASTYLGGKIDSSGMGAAGKEVGNLVVGTAGGAIGSVIQGGDPGEGAIDGLIGAVGGRVGSHAGTKTLDYIRTQSETPVKTAIGASEAIKKQTIDIEGQSQIVKDLNKTAKPGTGPDGKTKTYVDEAGALDQLRDTQSSRTAKQASDDVKDPIINTRTDKLYKPADDTTINTVTPDLIKKGIIKPGEKVEMDTFSTPGKGTPKQSLGADRDARLVVIRDDPEHPGQQIKVEIPREHWENQAYQDFHDHTTNIIGKENITPENYPNYYKRVEEMTHNNPQGLSKEQIQARAWAEEHNQLFTDKDHIEASRDNADQLKKFVNGQEVQTQVKSNVELTQKGESRLLDPEGYAKMWHEKSDVYARMGNQPEAIAQSQKGIEQTMKIRAGYDKQGYNVPPIDRQTQQAMEIITKAPVGVNATPEKMAQVNQQLQAIGFKNTNDALGKIAMQNENFAFATPKGASSASTIRIGMGTSEDSQRMDGDNY